MALVEEEGEEAVVVEKVEVEKACREVRNSTCSEDWRVRMDILTNGYRPDSARNADQVLA